MTQKSKLRNFFTKGQGLMIHINVPAIPAGDSKIYNRDCDELKNRFRIYGCFNWLDLCNTGTADIKVYLDNNVNRSIDCRCHEKMVEAEFVEFAVVNDSSEDLNADEAIIYLGYKVDEMRSHYLIDKMFGGGRAA